MEAVREAICEWVYLVAISAGFNYSLNCTPLPTGLLLDKPFFVPDDRVSNSLSEKPSDPTGLGYVLIGRLGMAVRIRTDTIPFYGLHRDKAGSRCAIRLIT